MSEHLELNSNASQSIDNLQTRVDEGAKKRTSITAYDYDETSFVEKEILKAEDVIPYKESPSTTWIDIVGLQNAGLIEEIGRYFNLHHLSLEDILYEKHRPKIEDFDDFILIILKTLHVDHDSDEIEYDQISIILGAQYVVSIQSRECNYINQIRDRIRNNKGRIRKAGADYLAYCLIDVVVDNYFICLDEIDTRIEQLEDDLLAKPTEATLHMIHLLKREMIRFRKAVLPLREIISSIERSESDLIQEATGIYFKDIYDHTIQIMDVIESMRDILTGMLDTYLSSMSHRMNQIMKVLTIIATIFIPLTFLVGVYGMNFDYLPELKWHWAYFALWGFMVGIVGLMLSYFKKKEWL